MVEKRKGRKAGEILLVLIAGLLGQAGLNLFNKIIHEDQLDYWTILF